MTRDDAKETVRYVVEIADLLNQLTDHVQSLSVEEDVKQVMRRGIADAMIGMNEWTLRAVIAQYPELDPFK
jgi:hypothetical protein